MTRPADKTLPAVQSVPVARHSRIRKCLRLAEHVLAAIGCWFIVCSAAFEFTVMTSDSMAPTLCGTAYDNGDRIVVEKVSGWFRKPRRWEVCYFYNDEGIPIAKRIVGLPGERISIRNNRVCVNQSEIRLPERLRFLNYYPYGNLRNGREINCGEGYYMLGDDSHDSYDSRFIGPVKGERFRGRVWCVVWPFGRIGFVNQ